jgi:hypothetical protein
MCLNFSPDTIAAASALIHYNVPRRVSATNVTNCPFEAEMNERRRQRQTGVATDTAYITWGNKVNLLKRYPLVLLVKVSWKEGKSLGK